MRTIILAVIALFGAVSASAVPTPRMGMNQFSIGQLNWGGSMIANFNILDSSVAIQGSTNTFTSSNTFVTSVRFSSTTIYGGIGQPVTPAVGDGGVYFDSSTKVLMVSQNGGAWIPMISTTGVVFVDSNSVTSVTLGLGNVAVTTVTATCRGTHPVELGGQVHINNATGATRVYTISIQRDGVLLGRTYLGTATNGSDQVLNIFATETSSVAGSHTYTLRVQSNSANVNQTVDSRELLFKEY